MDIVYVLDKKKPASTDALKFSIRALEKYMADMGAVYVVGLKPKNAPLAKHIDSDEPHSKDWQNYMHNVILAATDDYITDEFLLIDDTTIMLQPFNGEDYPFYRAKNGDGGPNGTYNFQLTCPIRINKEWYTQMPIKPDTKGDYAPRTFYCNFFRAPSYPADDVILRVGQSVAPIDAQLKNKPWVSLPNNALADPEVREYFDKLLPKPSSME